MSEALERVKTQLQEATRNSIGCSLSSGAVLIAATSIMEMENRILEEGLKNETLSEDAAKAVKASLARIQQMLLEMVAVYKSRGEQMKHEAVGLKKAVEAMGAEPQTSSSDG